MFRPERPRKAGLLTKILILAVVGGAAYFFRKPLAATWQKVKTNLSKKSNDTAQ